MEYMEYLNCGFVKTIKTITGVTATGTHLHIYIQIRGLVQFLLSTTHTFTDYLCLHRSFLATLYVHTRFAF